MSLQLGIIFDRIAAKVVNAEGGEVIQVRMSTFDKDLNHHHHDTLLEPTYTLKFNIFHFIQMSKLECFHMYSHENVPNGRRNRYRLSPTIASSSIKRMSSAFSTAKRKASSAASELARSRLRVFSS